MKPIIKYAGGKTRELKHILPYVPTFFEGRYIEPFFGGGALFFYLEPRRAIVNDINTKLMEFYLGVRNDFSKLRAELDAIENTYQKNRAEFEALMAQKKEGDDFIKDNNDPLFYHIRDMFNGKVEKEFSDACIYFFLNKTAYSGLIRYNASGEFNVPYGRYKNLNTHLVSEAHSKLLQSAEVYNKDYSEIFDMAREDDFMFLDPPYDCIFTNYGNEQFKGGFGEDEHRKLAERFYQLPCSALLVIGRTPLTEELYGNNIVGEYFKSYAFNIKNRFKAQASHILIMNDKRS